MKIGFGQADITPKGGKVSLLGQFELRVTDKVNDPLYAVAMVIQTDHARTIWVSADTCEMFEGTSLLTFEAVKKVVPDLKEDELVISATHIHTGPTLWLDTYLSLTGDRSEPKDAMPAAECNRQFAEGVAEAVRDAMDHLVEARAELAIARVQTGVCRRVVYKDGTAQMYGDAYRPDFLKMEGRDGGPMQLLYVYDEKDKLTGIVANVPCTAQCDENALYITADYWGVTRERIAEAFGKDVKVLPLCRSAGDLSPHHIVDRIPMERDSGCYRGRGGSLYMGNLVADAIISHKDKKLISYQGDVRHAQGMRKIDFPVWQVTEAEYRWAVDYLANKDNYSETGWPKSLFDNGNAHTRKQRYESGDKIYPSKVFATVLGDIVFISNPFELYIEYADRIRMALKDSVVFDVELSYDCLGYLATPNAVAGGHYSANIFNGVCAPDGGEVLVKESIDLAKSLLQQ